LETFCQQWKECLVNAEARRDELISWKQQGMFVFENDSKEDQFPSLIEEADNAAKIYKKILTRIESLRDRALNGEDV
jgi:hypothetical protein